MEQQQCNANFLRDTEPHPRGRNRIGRKIRACFINPPIRDFYTTSIRRQPLGLLYIMASVRDAGHEIEFINGHSRKRRIIPLPETFSYLKKYMETHDRRLAFPFPGYAHYGLSFDEIGRRMAHADADAFFIPSQFTPYHGESGILIAMARRIRPEAPVITGGHHAALYPEYMLRDAGADFVVCGAGEESSVALLDCIMKGDDPAGVPGIAYRNGASIAMTGRHTGENIDSIPLPARDLLRPGDFSAYRRMAVSMIASRGCPNRCSFCSVRTIWGDRYLVRSVDSVIAEIAECVERFGADMVNFEDDNLFHSRERAAALLDGLISFQKKSGRRLDLAAMNGISIEHLDDDIIVQMRRAGFSELNISLMTRSAALQESHGRPFDSGQFAMMARAARRRGMNVRAYFILGLPDQTAGEARETIAFLRDLDVKFFPSVYYNVNAPQDEWPLQRSSAFYNESDTMTRDDMVGLFNECMKPR
ncbi:MAG: B12-binding domain-containing radical SAM protein [Spirochaetes bacterium]|nr:B12-binding domain-containing radical SAM protein [Spirochaetota bacterium]